MWQLCPCSSDSVSLFCRQDASRESLNWWGQLRLRSRLVSFRFCLLIRLSTDFWRSSFVQKNRFLCPYLAPQPLVFIVFLYGRDWPKHCPLFCCIGPRFLLYWIKSRQRASRQSKFGAGPRDICGNCKWSFFAPFYAEKAWPLSALWFVDSRASLSSSISQGSSLALGAKKAKTG